MFTFSIPLAEPFNFNDAITSHGWWMLAPNVWDSKKARFYRTFPTRNNDTIVGCIYMEASCLQIVTEVELTETDQDDILDYVSWMFRVNERFEPFYTLCQTHNELTDLPMKGKGRLLRSPTLFEDIVKVLLTTNTRWNQTIQMAEKLTYHLGEKVYGFGREFYSFPTPQTILSAGEAFLMEHVRTGYRSHYILNAAHKAVNNPARYLQPSALNHFREIKGIGPYAMNTLAMIVGRYDGLPVDSEYKKHVIGTYFNGIAPSKSELESVYDKWGDYKYLAYWFDHYK
ncbi:DNA-3-methyladenine glycosylase family protein [Shouchella lehensis]|uniref:DNA-(apurinic or apyrimidinic site) lyase n=1 Tax=Shouchella lehensis G1 TaxID=1246626 RepID=A0A060LNF5_9BACI|nr:hypothetical protein [Shouchella lehensis]AIC92906.1 glycosylase [Shouchella lehensis G1]